MYEYKATLVRVVDGDTLHLTIDCGLDIKTKMTVRLYGLNCPEMSTKEGRAAKEFAEEWIRLNAPNYNVIVVTHKDKREKYGRYLGDILADDSSQDSPSLNEALLAAGHAVPYMV